MITASKPATEVGNTTSEIANRPGAAQAVRDRARLRSGDGHPAPRQTKPLTVSIMFLAITGWIGLILFSSTTTAAIWSENAFNYIFPILLGRLAPNTSSRDLYEFVAEKGVHITIFLILALLLWKAVPDQPKKLVVITAVAVLIGSSSELLQYLFQGATRQFTMRL